MIFQGVIGAFSGYIGGRGIGYINDQLGMHMSNYIANKTTRALLISLTSAIFKSSAVNILSTELLYIIGE